EAHRCSRVPHSPCLTAGVKKRAVKIIQSKANRESRRKLVVASRTERPGQLIHESGIKSPVLCLINSAYPGTPHQGIHINAHASCPQWICDRSPEISHHVVVTFSAIQFAGACVAEVCSHADSR